MVRFKNNVIFKKKKRKIPDLIIYSDLIDGMGNNLR